MAEVFVVLTHTNQFVGVYGNEASALVEKRYSGPGAIVDRFELPDERPSLSLSQIDWLLTRKADFSELEMALSVERTLRALRTELTKETNDGND